VRTTTRIAAASIAAMLIPSLGIQAASAVDAPEPGDRALYTESFQSDLSGWTAITGALTDWTVGDEALTTDTRGQASGRYIRPAASLDLPESYELRTRIRLDEVEAQGTATVMLDMRDTTNWKSTGISPQFAAFGSEGDAGFRMSQPVAGAFVCQGAAPVRKGVWTDLLVRRAGGITAVYAGDALIAAVTAPTAGGTIGFGSYKSRVSFGAVSVEALADVPEAHPRTAGGCSWAPAPTPPETPDPGTGTGEITGEGVWIPAQASVGDRPGTEVTGGQSSISLDGDWSFITDPDGTGVSAGHPLPETSTESWRTQRVPGNWDLHDGDSRYEGAAWYRRTFQSGNLSAADGERAWITFGAVYNDATVWLNGAKLGSHTGGYTPFRFDVTDYLIDGDNTLVVLADNSFQQGAWWSWGGISRSVALVKTGEVTVDRQQIVATPDLQTGTATVESSVFLRNAGDAARAVSLHGAITDADTGQVILDGLHTEVSVPAGGTATGLLSAQLPAGSFELWGMDDPNLYRLELTVDSPAAADDAAQSDRFGIREFRIDGTRMLLNGEVLKLAGGNRVSDDPVNGNVEPTWVVRRDLDRMKASGMNLARIMHYAQSPELLDYADEIGMLLIDEVPVWGTARKLERDIGQIQQEMREMVERDFNHPSIFAHSVANEIESNLPHGVEYLRKMADFSHQIDPSRFVTHANNKVERAETTSAEQDGTQFMDFASINLYGGYATGPDKMHRYYPDKPLFISEYSPDGFTFPVSRETLDFSTGADTTSANFKSRDFVFGWSQWTFNDYRSDHTGSSENLVRGWGNADVWGRLKAAYDETQTANAPVASFSLTGVAVGDGGGLGVVGITPSGAVPGAGPANILRGYRVTVQAFDDQGAVIGGNMIDLPEIAPGAEPLRVPVSWSGSAASHVRATLLSPTGYEVAVSTADAAAPAAPEISEIIEASGAIRVRFTDAAGIGTYRVVATAPDGTSRMKQTRELFADIDGLVDGTTYALTVAAVSSGLVGSAREATATPGGGLALAPRVINAEPVNGGVVLGYSSQVRDGWFEVRVTDAASGEVVSTYRTQSRPGTHAEGLPAGVTVDLRLRQITKDGEPVSVWSEALRATPLGHDASPKPRVRGLIAGTETAGIVLDPANRTERYRVGVRGPGVDTELVVERAGVDLIPVTGLRADSDYTITMVAEGPTGASSPWSGSVRTGVAAGEGPATVPSGVRVTNRGNDAFLIWEASDADGYVVTGQRCGESSSTTVIEAEMGLGRLGERPGVYTVAAIRGPSVSEPSAPVTVPGQERCPLIVSTADRSARADGSIPFEGAGGWLASGLTGPGDHPSVYAELPKTPGATATWTAPKAAKDVTYRIEAALPVSTTSSTAASYAITSADGLKTVRVDQVGRGGAWVDLGEYRFRAGDQPKVVLTGSGGFLRASALRLTDTSTADFPIAPRPGFPAQTVAPDGPITGTGTAAGNKVVVAAADGTVLADAVVADDLTWAARGATPLPEGVHTDVVATETDEDGWLGTATATVTVGGDKVRPLVALISPTTARPARTLDLRVEASDAGGLQRIVANIYRDGVLVKSTQTRVDGATSGTHMASVALPDGAYTVRYNAQDAAGNISKTGTFDVVVDTTAPTATVKDGDAFTLLMDGSYAMVSFKLHDRGKIDRVELNGKVKDLTDNQWSDVNFVRTGMLGAIRGQNTLRVYDVAGNVREVVFTLR
jgi:beta-galactosidase